MQLRLIRAENMPAALRAVRAELGEDALILTSRKIAGGIEVTAAREAPPGDLPPPLDPVRVAPQRASAATFAAHGVPAPLAARLAETSLERVLAFAPLPLAAPLLLAGPPGAGKTLTTAKLAAKLVLAGQRPMVITADGTRAGAVEQLAAFTRLLDLDLIVAAHPAALAKALAQREDQPVLIDAPGVDLLDPAGAELIGALRACAHGPAALVLPAGTDAEEAAATAYALARLGGSFLIPTRLDQARRLGAVVAAAGAGLAIAGYGTGPSVADGLADPDPTLLAARLATPPAFPGAP
jgi:flagellar biosynthesis protein FlhF